MSRVNIEISARNSWEICVDLKLHKINRLLLVDGEEFKNILLLKNKMEELRRGYTNDSGFLDRIFLMKVVFGFEKSNNKFLKIPIPK